MEFLQARRGCKNPSPRRGRTTGPRIKMDGLGCLAQTFFNILEAFQKSVPGLIPLCKFSGRLDERPSKNGETDRVNPQTRQRGSPADRRVENEREQGRFTDQRKQTAIPAMPCPSLPDGKLKRAGLSPQLLTNFYRATIESILCLSAAVWYGSCTAQDRKDLARVVKTAQGIVGSPLPDLDSIYAGLDAEEGPEHIAADPTHPGKWTVLSSSMARGDGVPATVMSKQTPHLISQHNALLDDMTATAAHYSGQAFDSAVDMPDKLSSEDYFSLCVSDSSAEAQADTGIQMGANADRAIVLSCTQEQSVPALQQEAACKDDTMSRACKLMASCLIMSSGDPGPLITPLRPTAVPIVGHYGHYGVWGGGGEVEWESECRGRR
ncbi:hypothetical protein L3Q82_011300 [Scortum barcoo]|uniref:Uncharacterized protein n=1 Tax=Scortum barcoo TaxID=214431 RepID=A0ACB8WAM0_9TELE|nr:hypothetical protein L3Q82_011300 [Scortum barcoo]